MNRWKNTSHDKSSLMRDKRWLKRLGRVKTWQLLIILLIFVMLTAIFLRTNNLNMLDRANELKELVKAETPVDLEKIEHSTRELQKYVSNHMNTTTGRIALQNVYDQAFLAVVEANSPKEFAGADYNAAANACMGAFRASGYRAWATCVANTIGTSDASLESVEQAAPNPDAYYVEFAPVRWSLDLAGVCLLICLVLSVIIVVRLIVVIILKIVLKFKYRAA